MDFNQDFNTDLIITSPTNFEEGKEYFIKIDIPTNLNVNLRDCDKYSGLYICKKVILSESGNVNDIYCVFINVELDFELTLFPILFTSVEPYFNCSCNIFDKVLVYHKYSNKVIPIIKDDVVTCFTYYFSYITCNVFELTTTEFILK